MRDISQFRLLVHLAAIFRPVARGCSVTGSLMPTPHMDTKSSDQLEISSRFLVELLDAKFAKQEALIRQLLEPDGAQQFSQKLAVEAPEIKEIKEPVLEVCDLDFPEEKMEVERPDTPKGGTRKLGLTIMKERWEPDPPWKLFVKGPLDGYMGIVVLINLGFMILETQSTGAVADATLGLAPANDWTIPENFFQVAEYMFFTMYVLDVLVRIVILRHEWYFDPRQGFMILNVFDAFVVAVNAFELLVLPVSLGLSGHFWVNFWLVKRQFFQT